MIKQTVIFKGHVQGVGFRFNTHRVAKEFTVTGTVQNLPDGSVELIAEGESTEVKDFVEAVQETMAGHVTEHTVDETPATGQYRGFNIKH